MKSIVYFTVGMTPEEDKNIATTMDAILNENDLDETQIVECDRLTMDFWFRTKMQEQSRMNDAEAIKRLFDSKPEFLTELTMVLNGIKDSLETPTTPFSYFNVVNHLGCEYPYAKHMMKCAEALGFVSKTANKNTFVYVDTTDTALHAVINKIEGLNQTLLVMEKFKELLESNSQLPEPQEEEIIE